MTSAMIPSATALRRRAEQCLRFADQLDLIADPSVPALRALAQEYLAQEDEAAARALEAPPRRTDGPLTLPRREPDRRSSS